MKSITGFLALFIILLGGYGPPAVSADSTPQLPGFTPSNSGLVAQAPVYQDGEYWVYKLEVDWITPPDSYFSDRIASGVYQAKRSATKFLTDYPPLLDRSPVLYDQSSDREWYRFPLRAGYTWNGRYLASPPGRRSTWRDTQTKVVREGEIVTKAGKFRVLESVQEWRDIAVYAYSPDAKAAVVIYVEQRNTRGEKFATWRLELIEYSVK